MSAKDNRNLDSRRAGFAYTQVAGWGESWRKEAVKLVKGLPITLRTQGLPVTLAVLMNGNKTHKRELAILMEQWILDVSPRKLFSREADASHLTKPGQRLLDICLNSDRATHLAAQAEAMAVLEYVKLFASALWEGEDEIDKGQSDE